MWRSRTVELQVGGNRERQISRECAAPVDVTDIMPICSRGWSPLTGDVPAATAILDRFLHHAHVVALNRQKLPAKEPGGEASEAGREGEGTLQQGRVIVYTGLRWSGLL